MGLISEFREFALRGNVVDLAVGVIIGAAFGKIVGVMVDKVLMPPIGYIAGGIDFADKKLVLAAAKPELKDAATGAITQKAIPEVAIGWGEFVNASIYFIIVAFCLFIVIKLMNTAKQRFEADKPVPAPAGPSPQEKLLMEIRDAIKAGR
ncbi:MAG: large-conductance mechanosensitive channel protein MscL [Phycisphaerales bacterium]